MKIIAATHNKDKIREIRQILADAGVCIGSMSEAWLDALDVEENGSAFEENATLKAEEVTRLTGIAALADDSGLCVDALAGAPGIYSARYAGPEADTRANNAKLLEAMRDVPEAERTGRYVSAVALAYPDGRLLVGRGECEGRILYEERGSGGFGYDTLFAPEGSERSFAVMSAEEKNRISQRSRALAQLRDALTHED